MSSSLLLQQCPMSLVRLIWMVFEVDGWRSYSCPLPLSYSFSSSGSFIKLDNPTQHKQKIIFKIRNTYTALEPCEKLNVWSQKVVRPGYTCFIALSLLLGFCGARKRRTPRKRSIFGIRGEWFSTRWWLLIIKQHSYLPNPSARAGYDTRSIFKRSLTGLNSDFSFS